ncbi:MAG: sigma-70 family RNA polymerase sigma factor [Deltaproteobacteria bacterium]|nr:MAG: sigma-70 family RNA polymerase sigma factor [Deltaproteobacteria bacterium]UCH08219.1 MAG: sigma-70 family RNA polymerase sigma factor [Deltaproteobacteria bacterium]
MSGQIDFAKLYEQYQPKIIQYLSRLTGNYEAEDLAQEVFERVFRAIEEFKGESTLSTWLYRIAKNIALDRLRSPSFNRSLQRSSLEDCSEVVNGDPWGGQPEIPLDQQLIRKEMRECVRGYIEEFPPDYKDVIILSEFEGFKNREIADTLQVSLDTVKIRLHRARARMERELGNCCFFYRNEHGVFVCDRKHTSVIS